MALKVSAIYIGVSLLYIFFSDYIVTSLFSDLQTIRTISTFKGWGFVILSGALIYVLIRQSQKKSIISEAFLRSIIENEPECVKIIGFEGELKFMNPAGLKMLEIDDLEFVQGKCVYPLILEEHRNAFIELNQRVFKGESGTLQFQIVGHKGTKLWLETKAVPLYNSNGKIESSLGLSQNITERKRTEEDLILNLKELELAKIRAEEADNLKTAFLANMSHEIRTPMNAIMGFSELLDMEDMPFDKRQKFTKIIKDRSTDLMAIINDLLDISRIESHTLKIVETKGNISDKLVEIKEYFETRNEEIYLKPITYDLFNQLSYEQCFVETDFERIKQVLINLIDNAFKFTIAGTIHLGCELINDKTLQFSVSDTGIGIPKDKHQIIFERFRQIEESYLTRDFGGSGLGLSICKGILELMHGNMWVESELGKGSTFYFTVPYKPIPNSTSNNPNLNTISFDFHEKTILIVEDIDYNQAYLKELLEETNAKLLFASNGTIALEIFEANSNIDVVLMDIRLPDIHGIDLTKMMITKRSDIKIIAQTAYASSDDKNKCYDAGCIDFISKPISQKTLLEMLQKHITQ